MNEESPKISSILIDHYKTKIIASMQHDETFRMKVQKMIDEKRNKEIEKGDECTGDQGEGIALSYNET